MEILQVYNVRSGSPQAPDMGARTAENPSSTILVMDNVSTLGLESLSSKQRKNAPRGARHRAAQDTQRVGSNNQPRSTSSAVNQVNQYSSRPQSPLKDMSEITGEAIWPADPGQSASGAWGVGELPYACTGTLGDIVIAQSEATSRAQSLSATSRYRNHSDDGSLHFTGTYVGPASEARMLPQSVTNSNQVRVSVTFIHK